jgi:cyanoexosortase B-associated protein
MQKKNILDQSLLSKLLLLLLLFLLLGGSAIPSYIKGQWQWKEPPAVPGLKKLQELQGKGITIPGWETIKQVTIEPGGHKWLLHDLTQENQKALLLLRAQRGPTEQPQVEWMDINGYWRWEPDADMQSEFTVEIPNAGDIKPETATVKARYFRGITKQETYAVMQWYAFPDGGHPAPSHWFWRDRLYQLSGKREPWVAICIIIPIEPFGDIEKTRPLAESLAKTVQATLMAGPLQRE